eukprot:scaffold2936_cov25-Tisochrysis_lutea.AAC.3
MQLPRHRCQREAYSSEALHSPQRMLPHRNRYPRGLAGGIRSPWPSRPSTSSLTHSPRDRPLIPISPSCEGKEEASPSKATRGGGMGCFAKGPKGAGRQKWR